MTGKSELLAHFHDLIIDLFKRVQRLDIPTVEIEEFTASGALLIRARINSRTQRNFFVAIREMVRPSHFETLESIIVEKASQNTVPVIAAPSLSDTVIAECHKRSWGHLDGGGNCLLSSFPIFIERAGYPIPPEFKPTKRKASFILTTEREARVVRAILRGDRLKQSFDDRLVESWCGHTPCLGYIYNLLRYFESQGYIERASNEPGFRLKNPAALLRDWAAARAEAPDYSIKSYKVGLSDLHSVMDGLNLEFQKNVALAAYSANPKFLEQSSELPVYLRTHMDVLPKIEDFLKLRPCIRTEQPDVILIASQSKVALQDIKTQNGRNRTSALQTYADLLSLPNGYVAADELLNTLILPHLRKAGFKSEVQGDRQRPPPSLAASSPLHQ